MLKMIEKLESLVAKYGENNEKLKSLKKSCDADNAEIKKMIKELELVGKPIDTEKFSATMRIQKRETVNEDKLLELAHANNLDVIGTKEYIDFDRLENLIYNDKISKDVLLEIDKCRETKEVEVLTVSKYKEKKDE